MAFAKSGVYLFVTTGSDRTEKEGKWFVLRPWGDGKEHRLVLKWPFSMCHFPSPAAPWPLPGSPNERKRSPDFPSGAWHPGGVAATGVSWHSGWGQPNSCTSEALSHFLQQLLIGIAGLNWCVSKFLPREKLYTSLLRGKGEKKGLFFFRRYTCLLLKMCTLTLCCVSSCFLKFLFLNNYRLTWSCKHSTDRSWAPSTQVPSLVISYVIRVQYPNQEAGFGILCVYSFMTFYYTWRAPKPLPQSGHRTVSSPQRDPVLPLCSHTPSAPIIPHPR